MSTNQSPRFSTPKGVAVYPRLARPDVKYHDLGIYKADLLVDMADAKPLLVKLSEIFKAHTGKAVNKFDNSMFNVETDEDGEQTGKVLFKLRVKNRMGRDNEVWDRKPKLFDAMATPCPDAKPYGGSEMIVNFEAYAWDMSGKKGVSLQPVAIQIIKLESGGGQDAGGYGFEATPGGFVSETMPAAEDADFDANTVLDDDTSDVEADF